MISAARVKETIMRFTTASMAAIVLLAGAAAPAFAKGHLQPTDGAGQHVFGQERAHTSYIVGGDTAAIDANKNNPAGDGVAGLTDMETLEAARSTDRGSAGGKTPE
jgi:hypothetical protein